MMEGWRIKAGLRGNKASVGFKQNRPHKTHSAYARQSRRAQRQRPEGSKPPGRDKRLTSYHSLLS